MRAKIVFPAMRAAAARRSTVSTTGRGLEPVMTPIAASWLRSTSCLLSAVLGRPDRGRSASVEAPRSPAAQPFGPQPAAQGFEETHMALTLYLTLKGEKQGDIKGSVTQKGHEGTIAVVALDHGIQSPRD